MVAPLNSKPAKLPGESEADYQKRLKNHTNKSNPSGTTSSDGDNTHSHADKNPDGSDNSDGAQVTDPAANRTQPRGK